MIVMVIVGLVHGLIPVVPVLYDLHLLLLINRLKLANLLPDVTSSLPLFPNLVATRSNLHTVVLVVVLLVVADYVPTAYTTFFCIHLLRSNQARHQPVLLVRCPCYSRGLINTHHSFSITTSICRFLHCVKLLLSSMSTR
jgi:hypothetical protein